MARRRKRKLKKGFVFLLLLLMAGGAFFALRPDKENDKKELDNKKEIVPEKKLQILDLESDSRPIAVMINNHPSARPYHSGLQDAYLTYEIIVEGGYTRYMAIFKDKDTKRIGSIRSSRHYFLDYALENGAVYVHWGWSPEAQNQIKSYKVNNINGLTLENKYFFRDNSLKVNYEHRGFTSMELIKKGITGLGYSDKASKDVLLNYSVDEIDLRKMTGAQVANNVIIPYSGAAKTSYTYDSVNKVYLRYANDKAHVDYVTKKQYIVKNIITYQVSNHTLSSDVKGRQDIDNLGSGTGYYITNGYAVPIKWEKKYKASQTIYTFEDGTEINVNDGNTYIQIQPSSKKLTISE